MLVVGHAREEVVAPGRDVSVRRPLFPLQRHVALLLALLEIVEQHRHAVAGCVLEGERDEDEADAELAKLVPGDRLLLVVPFKRRRIVEGEASPRESLLHLAPELLSRPA